MAASDNVQSDNSLSGALRAGSNGRTVSSDVFTFTAPFYTQSTMQQPQHSTTPSLGLLPPSDPPLSYAVNNYSTSSSHPTNVLNMPSTNHNATNIHSFGGLHAQDGMGGVAAAGTETQGTKPAVVDGLLQRYVFDTLYFPSTISLAWMLLLLSLLVHSD